MPPELRKRWERQKRQEMMQRKADLPDTAKPALKIIEGFEKEQLRMWMVPLDRMRAEAVARGANAIVGMRVTTSTVMQGAAEILAYGTAVVIEPE